MKSAELLRKLTRRGARIVADRGKGGHVMVILGERQTFVPTGTGELRKGTLSAILKQLGLRPEDLT